MDYVQVINGDISLKVMTNSLPTKGKLVYEYNPLRNYRLSENKYLSNFDFLNQEIKIGQVYQLQRLIQSCMRKGN